MPGMPMDEQASTSADAASRREQTDDVSSLAMASHISRVERQADINDVMTMPTDEVLTDRQRNAPAASTNAVVTPLPNDAVMATDTTDAFFNEEPPKQQLNTEDSESFSPDDPDIKQDAAERYVSCIVHAMLFFFVALAGISAFLAIILVSQYGFFAIVVITLLLLIIIGIVMFVDKVMKEDTRLRPVRRQIQRWKAVATAVVLKEIRDFQLDWNEHLLLTDGSEYDLYDDDVVPAMDVDNAAAAAQSTKPKKKRGGRSAIFKIVKPFLKVGGRRRARKRKEKEAAAAAGEGDSSEAYVPPVV